MKHGMGNLSSPHLAVGVGQDVGVDDVDDALLQQPQAHAVDDAHVGDGQAHDLHLHMG